MLNTAGNRVTDYDCPGKWAWAHPPLYCWVGVRDHTGHGLVFTGILQHHVQALPHRPRPLLAGSPGTLCPNPPGCRRSFIATTGLRISARSGMGGASPRPVMT